MAIGNAVIKGDHTRTSPFSQLLSHRLFRCINDVNPHYNEILNESKETGLVMPNTSLKRVWCALSRYRLQCEP